MQKCKWKCFEYNFKKETFWIKLIFNIKEQERDFMISFDKEG